jgi:mannose-1-phosphate guanylyltransferase/mannose-6-phosphate isomerase
MPALVPVVLAGGAGTRLWPLSRKLFPKQFQKLIGEHSMLQETMLRLDGLDHAKPILVCSDEHRFLVAEQCRSAGLEWSCIVLEPVPRNTAPAIALGALKALDLHDDPILLVLPSDHFVQNAAAFRQAITEAQTALGNGLMTFGIVPTAPQTGYGYIKRGTPVSGQSRVAGVERFVEKPNAETARVLMQDGQHFWNSGMFLFRAAVFLAELEQHRPDIFASASSAYNGGEIDLEFFFRPAKSFEDCPSESIDYAVMEKTRNALVMPADIGWSDVGSWSALWEVSSKDERGNTFQGDVVDRGSRNSFVHADHRLIATLGLEDCVVVETRDAVLVARKDEVQHVKDLVDDLKSHHRSEHEAHVQVFRPWGSFQGLETGSGFQVKHITVNPGASLSLQMHHHRSEHWIVVRGMAKVVCGEREFELSENQSTYIPVGTRHRLSNPGESLLELIEVQVGSYLGEDDIVRFDDVYGRS